MALVTCPGCSNPVSDTEPSCAKCGRSMSPLAQGEVVTAPEWSPVLAAVLSLIIPGAGQMYKGQRLNGFLWLFVVTVGYAFFVIPGAVLHLCCIIGAALGTPPRVVLKSIVLTILAAASAS